MEKFNPRILSRLGQSGSIFGLALLDSMNEYRLKVVSADMSVVAGLDRFKKLYPNDFYNVGIAEQNMLGIASGLSSEGYKSIAVAQACFLSMRSFEQIRQYLGYMHNDVICVGINSGVSLTYFGNTHYAIEDISLMRSIPNMTVISPSDSGIAVKAFDVALRHDGPVYIRLNGGLNCPIVYNNDFNFTIGKSNVVKEGSDVTIFATGSMVYKSLMAAELITDVSIKVVDVTTIVPLDVSEIYNSKSSKLFVTIEEHNIIGGLGSAISEVMSSVSCMPPLLRLGIKGFYDRIGDYNYLLEKARLTPELIAEDIMDKYRSL